jgi:hypothetical protein
MRTSEETADQKAWSRRKSIGIKQLQPESQENQYLARAAVRGVTPMMARRVLL